MDGVFTEQLLITFQALPTWLLSKHRRLRWQLRRWMVKVWRTVADLWRWVSWHWCTASVLATAVLCSVFCVLASASVSGCNSALRYYYK